MGFFFTSVGGILKSRSTFVKFMLGPILLFLFSGVKPLYKSRTFATFLLSQQSIPAGFATPGSGVSV